MIFADLQIDWFGGAMLCGMVVLFAAFAYSVEIGAWWERIMRKENWK